MEEDRLATLASTFMRALACVSAAGFAHEVRWARETRFSDLTEQVFLSEYAWCVLNSGMREVVVRRKWPEVSSAFWRFHSAATIVDSAEACVRLARRAFDHEGKVRAIVAGAERVRALGFRRFKEHVAADPITELRRLPFIGPITVWHLARNIGIDCAKPDRHLARLAERHGFESAAALCGSIATLVRERIGVVDVVLWRHLASSCGCTGVDPARAEGQRQRHAPSPRKRHGRARDGALASLGNGSQRVRPQRSASRDW